MSELSSPRLISRTTPVEAAWSDENNRTEAIIDFVRPSGTICGRYRRHGTQRFYAAEWNAHGTLLSSEEVGNLSPEELGTDKALPKLVPKYEPEESLTLEGKITGLIADPGDSRPRSIVGFVVTFPEQRPINEKFLPLRLYEKKVTITFE